MKEFFFICPNTAKFLPFTGVPLLKSQKWEKLSESTIKLLNITMLEMGLIYIISSIFHVGTVLSISNTSYFSYIHVFLDANSLLFQYINGNFSAWKSTVGLDILWTYVLPFNSAVLFLLFQDVLSMKEN